LGIMPFHEPLRLFDRTTFRALIAAVIGAALGAYLIAAEALKGQTVFAAIGGGVLAAAFGRLASQSVSPVLFLIGVVIVATLGPVTATLAHPPGLGLVQAAIEGSLFRLARPLPFDWLAGGFIGVPLGLWWAGSMIEKQEQGNW
jgi:hypothetical protein